MALHQKDIELNSRLNNLQKQVEKIDEEYRKGNFIDKSAMLRLQERDKTTQKIFQLEAQIPQQIKAREQTWQLALREHVCPKCGGELKEDAKDEFNVIVGKTNYALKCADCKKIFPMPEPLPEPEKPKPLPFKQRLRIWLHNHPFQTKL